MTLKIQAVGTVATEPKEIKTQSGTYFCSFRLACNERRFDRSRQEWIDGKTSWITVNVFKRLGENVQLSFKKGDRVIVIGKLRVSKWEKDDRVNTSVEIDAESIGHDLLWGTSTFSKRAKSDAHSSEDDETEATESGTGLNSQEFGAGETQEEPMMAAATPF